MSLLRMASYPVKLLGYLGSSSSALVLISIEFTAGSRRVSPNDKTFGTLSIELATPEGGSLTFEMDVRDAG